MSFVGSGLGPRPTIGDLYIPDRGEHEGHIVEFLGNTGVRGTALGEHFLSNIVRCQTCLLSWTFPRGDQDV